MDTLWAEILTKIKEETKKLEDHLSIMDEGYYAVQKIDREILKPRSKLKDFLEEILEDIISLFSIDVYHVFLIHGDRVFPIDAESEKHTEVALQANLNFGEIETSEKKLSFRFERKVFIILHRHENPYCMIMFDGYTRRSETDRFKNFIDTAGGQLEILINRYHDDKISRTTAKLTDLLLDDKLDTEKSWVHIVNSVIPFFPSWRHFDLNLQPLVQLFLYSEGDDHLRFAAASTRARSSVGEEKEHDLKFPTHLLVNESITGEALKQKSDYLLINPSHDKYRHLYKGYQRSISKSELVIKIKSTKEVIGLLNFEHPEEGVFSSLYVKSALEIASIISPFVNAIKRRREEARRKEILVMHIFEGFLERIGDTFQHKLAQPLLIARDSLSEYDYCRSRGTVVADGEIRKLRDSLAKIQEYSDEFAELLPGFMSLGPSSVELLLKRCGASFESRDYRLVFGQIEPELYVYASSLLNEHLFNLVNNATHAIKKRIFTEEIETGVIQIDVRRESLTDSLGEETGIAFVDIVIGDNGGGAKNEDFDKIGRWGFTTKSDNIGEGGFGIAAAREYVEALGGRLSWRNRDQGFEVVMRLHEFNEKFHRRGSIGRLTPTP